MAHDSLFEKLSSRTLQQHAFLCRRIDAFCAAMAKDYYAVLGLARGADDVVVHAAWKALLRKYHPDTNASSDAQARARDINEAFAVLGKPQSRAAYDRTRAAPPPPRPGPRPAPRPGPSSTYRPAQPPPYRGPAKRPPLQGRRLGAVLLLIAAIPAAILTLNQYPYALVDLRDRLRGYADFDTPSIAAFTSAGYDGGAAVDDGSKTPPPLDRTAIAAAVRRAVAVMNKGGMPLAAKASRTCDDAARDWPGLDDCIAFDVAVSLIEATSPGALDTPDPYFIMTAQRGALRAEQMDRDPARAATRVSAIRTLVVPQVMAVLVAQIRRSPARPAANNAVSALSLR